MRTKKSKISLFLIGICFSILGVFAQSSSTEVEFYNSFTSPYCYSPSSLESYWVVGNELLDSRTYTGEGVGCYKSDGFPATTCCPISKSLCIDSGGGNYYCDDGPQHCNEFTSESECNQGHPIIAANDLETDSILGSEGLVCNAFGGRYGTNGVCYNYTSCMCKWIDGKCNAVAKQKIYDGTDFRDESYSVSTLKTTCSATEEPNLGTCNFIFNITDNCETIGFLMREWTVTSTGIAPSYCYPGNDRIPCLDVVKLGFFGIISLLIAIAIIVAIYWFFINKNK